MAESHDPVAEAAARAGLSDQDVVRSEIEQTRAELAETVDALSNKLDVKARATEKAAEVKAKIAPYRLHILGGAAVAVVAVVVVKWRRRS